MKTLEHRHPASGPSGRKARREATKWPPVKRRAGLSMTALLLSFAIIAPSAYPEAVAETVLSSDPLESVHTRRRKSMVAEQIERRGVSDPTVLTAMRKVERHLFVPPFLVDRAYSDRPLPIGHRQTISQPFIVALMTEAARLKSSDKVLEIGTGSGYQAAILGEIVESVYTIEILEPLAMQAKERLASLGYENVHVKHGDGYQGWPEFAPFDAIIVTAAPDEIPQKLVEQLKVGGRMVIPVGSVSQELKLIIKTDDGVREEEMIPVRFVPMVKS